MGISLWFPWCLTLLLVCNIPKNCSTLSTSTTIMCIQSERQALLQFKQGLLDKFGYLSSWGSKPEKKDCCNWLGVSCNNHSGNVVELNLYNMSLQGPISTSLVRLYGLTILDLSFNYLVGEIPNQLGNLHDLRALKLSFSSLKGEIPNQLGNLHALRDLDLSWNNLVGEIPNQLGNLYALRALDLSWNNLVGEIPNQLGNLHALRALDLSGNHLVGEIPNQLGNLHALRVLDLSWNRLVGEIPNQLGNLHALRVLDLYSNNLVGEIPNQLGNLSILQSLDLGVNCALSSTKLEWLSSLSQLSDIDLSHINLTKAFDWLQVVNTLPSLMSLSLDNCSLPNILFPPTLSHFNSSKTLGGISLSYNNLKSCSIFNWLFNHSNTLVSVDLSSNQLDGALPDFFGNMISLEFILFSKNRFHGGIPKSFANLSSLIYLDLSYNNLTKISGFSWWDFLWYLNLESNLLSGSIPESIGNISTLEYLDLSHNFLQGTFSEGHMSNLSSLKHLLLSHNNLLIINISSNWIPPFQLNTLVLSHCKVGPDFPNWLRRHINLGILDISNVGIQNSVPRWFWDELTPQLLYLNMSANQMWGTISSSAFQSIIFSKWTLTLDLSSNHFVGQIPALHANSTYIDLSNNQFSGPLHAPCLTELLILEMLDLSNNLLSGEIHGCKTRFPNLAMLNLANNSFSGEFPDLVGSSCQLTSLHLENNNFTGVLPWQLQNCEKLQVMDLRTNKFLGNMPMWIGQNLLNLVILSLQANNFDGSLPIHLCNLTKLQILDLSLNNFFGSIPTCFCNFAAMALSQSSNLTITINTNIIATESYGYYDTVYPRNDYAALALKGGEFLYKNTLGLVKGIDLSSNKLSGKIPKEITLLVGLISLNLSRNNLMGQIPSQIGQMQQLESLDLSRNKLYGPIPTSLSRLNFLSSLDLRNNNLSGRIPRSAHLDTINASAYEGNKGLCGPPLTSDCPGDEVAESPSDAGGNGDADAPEEKNEIISLGFYVCMVFGFIVGFWGVFGTLLVKESWRNVCVMFLINMKDEIHVAIAVSIASLKRGIEVQRDELRQRSA